MSVVAAVTSDACRGVLRGIERRERQKHLRYPGRWLYPFVVDVRGKWGREAHALVQAMAGSWPKDKRADAIITCRRRVAVALQTGIANQIHTAGDPLDLSTDISYVVGRPLDTVIEETLNGNMPAGEDASMSAEARTVAAAGG